MKAMTNVDAITEAEKPAESSSDETKQAEITPEAVEPEASEGVKTPEVEEGSEEQKTVPYDRFQEVIKERNTYKELLDTGKTPEVSKETQDQAAELSQATDMPYEDALKVVDERVKKQVGDLERKWNLDRAIDKNPDFFKYADSIKEEVKSNPALTWEQAYKLVKYDTAQADAHTVAMEKAQKSVAKKQAASVETASKAKTSPVLGEEEIDPLAKGPDGKYLYTKEELEQILPKGKNDDY